MRSGLASRPAPRSGAAAPGGPPGTSPCACGRSSAGPRPPGPAVAGCRARAPAAACWARTGACAGPPAGPPAAGARPWSAPNRPPGAPGPHWPRSARGAFPGGPCAGRGVRGEARARPATRLSRYLTPCERLCRACQGRAAGALNPGRGGKEEFRRPVNAKQPAELSPRTPGPSSRLCSLSGGRPARCWAQRAPGVPPGPESQPCRPLSLCCTHPALPLPCKPSLGGAAHEALPTKQAGGQVWPRGRRGLTLPQLVERLGLGNTYAVCVRTHTQVHAKDAVTPDPSGGTSSALRARGP